MFFIVAYFIVDTFLISLFLTTEPKKKGIIIDINDQIELLNN